MTNTNNNKIAVVFPGQGSQKIGMLEDLAKSHPEVINLFTKASEVLNYDLWDLVQNGPDNKLNQTEYTQPALLVSSVAVWNVYNNINSNIVPSVLAGHSLGEYSALVAANSLDFLDAVELVAARGKFMQEAVPVGTGAMAAVLGLDNNIISDVICDINKVEIANLNAIGQTVIAGDKNNIELAVTKLKIAGAKLVKVLDVSVPSHCSLMSDAAERLLSLLNKVNFKKPSIPVIHNYSVECYNNPDDIRLALYKQLTHSVRWVETIEKMAAMYVHEIYEFGPGDVLTKLCKRISKALKPKAINSTSDFSVLVELLEN